MNLKTFASVLDSPRTSRMLGLAIFASLCLLACCGPQAFAPAARTGATAVLLWTSATFLPRQSKFRWLLVGLGLGLLVVGLLAKVLVFSRAPVVTQVPFSFPPSTAAVQMQR